MPHTTVLFDLDGTLLDTLDDLAESANQVLVEMGAEAHPRDAYRYFVGDGIDMLGRRALPEAMRSDSHVERFVTRMREVYAPRETLKTRAYDGIPELLDGLRSGGITMCPIAPPGRLSASCSGDGRLRWCTVSGRALRANRIPQGR
jgi:phosphoglycolate phosphatase